MGGAVPARDRCGGRDCGFGRCVLDRRCLGLSIHGTRLRSAIGVDRGHLREGKSNQQKHCRRPRPEIPDKIAVGVVSAHRTGRDLARHSRIPTRLQQLEQTPARSGLVQAHSAAHHGDPELWRARFFHCRGPAGSHFQHGDVAGHDRSLHVACTSHPFLRLRPSGPRAGRSAEPGNNPEGIGRIEKTHRSAGKCAALAARSCQVCDADRRRLRRPHHQPLRAFDN